MSRISVREILENSKGDFHTENAAYKLVTVGSSRAGVADMGYRTSGSAGGIGV